MDKQILFRIWLPNKQNHSDCIILYTDGTTEGLPKGTKIMNYFPIYEKPLVLRLKELEKKLEEVNYIRDEF